MNEHGFRVYDGGDRFVVACACGARFARLSLQTAMDDWRAHAGEEG